MMDYDMGKEESLNVLQVKCMMVNGSVENDKAKVKWRILLMD